MKDIIRPKDKKLTDLKIYFDKNVLAIPELQRNFVWNATRFRDLADSIYKGYSIGTFTIWDAPKKREDFLKQLKGALPPYDSANNTRIHYVIDGQQRLIVLYSFLNPGVEPISNDSGATIYSQNVCFAVKKEEENLNFVYAKKKIDRNYYFPLCHILSDNYKDRFSYLTKKHKGKLKLIEECRKRFFSYPFIFTYFSQDIKEDSLRETFIRLNTRGLSLRSVDRAYTYASDVRLREYVARIKDRLGIFKTISEHPFHEIIYMISKHKEGATRFNSRGIEIVIRNLNDDKEERENFQKKEWRIIAKAVSGAEKFLKSQGVISLKYLPSTTMVAVLSTYFYYKRSSHISETTRKKLKQWFWYTAVLGRYSGGGYYRYPIKDCKVMESLAKGGHRKFEDFDIKLRHEEIDNAQYYADRSSLVRAFYCLLALQKPREFFSDTELELRDPNYSERKHNHHVFPENLMYKNGVAARKYNSIINICFLPQETNDSFYADAPWDYLDDDKIYRTNLSRTLKSHLIPSFITKKNSNLKKAFDRFYDKRKSKIMEMLEGEAGISLFEDDND